MILGKPNLSGFDFSSVKWGITHARSKWYNGCKWLSKVLAPLTSYKDKNNPGTAASQDKAESLRALGNRWGLKTSRAWLYRCLCPRSEVPNRTDKKRRKQKAAELSACLLILFSLHLFFSVMVLICVIINKYSSVSFSYRHTPCTVWYSGTRAQGKFIFLCPI